MASCPSAWIVTQFPTDNINLSVICAPVGASSNRVRMIPRTGRARKLGTVGRSGPTRYQTAWLRSQPLVLKDEYDRSAHSPSRRGRRSSDLPHGTDAKRVSLGTSDA